MYEIGDYVLCDHPRLKKGVSRGLARKYYGPFIIKDRRENVSIISYKWPEKNEEKLIKSIRTGSKRTTKSTDPDDSSNRENSATTIQADTIKTLIILAVGKSKQKKKQKKTLRITSERSVNKSKDLAFLLFFKTSYFFKTFLSDVN